MNATESSLLRERLAKLMLYGTLLAAVVMLAGGIVFLAAHAGQTPGDHVFRGEPGYLRHPVAMVRAIIAGNDSAVIQAGVLLLMLNPLVRVAFAAAGYAAGKDWLYAAISAGVFAVLAASFFL